MNFAKEVWDKFHAIDVKPMMKELKGGVQYVSWSNVWEVIMENYPRSHYSFKEERIVHVGDNGPEENVEVWCSLTIVSNDDSLPTATATLTREMWLPVMQSFGQFLAISNPSAREISDTRMRCMVKCAAMHGLGLSAWTGEDYQPDPTVERTVEFAKKKADYRMGLWKTAIVIKEAFIEESPAEAAEAWMECDESEKTDLWIAQTKGGFFTIEEKEWLRAATLEAMQPENKE